MGIDEDILNGPISPYNPSSNNGGGGVVMRKRSGTSQG